MPEKKTGDDDSLTNVSPSEGSAAPRQGLSMGQTMELTDDDAAEHSKEAKRDDTNQVKVEEKEAQPQAAASTSTGSTSLGGWMSGFRGTSSRAGSTPTEVTSLASDHKNELKGKLHHISSLDVQDQDAIAKAKEDAMLGSIQQRPNSVSKDGGKQDDLQKQEDVPTEPITSNPDSSESDHDPLRLLAGDAVPLSRLSRGTATIQAQDSTPGAYAMPGMLGDADSVNATGGEAATVGETVDTTNINVSNDDEDETSTIFGATLVTDTDTPAAEALDMIEEGHSPTEEQQEVSMELIEATAVPTRPPTKAWKGWLLILAGVAILGSILGAILVLIPDSSSDNNSTDSRPRPSLNGPHPPFTADLEKSTLNAIQNDPDSASYKANLWMLNDPNLGDYSPERQIQRFYLAWWYHVTGGENWFRNDYWLWYNVSECEWYNNRDTEWIPDDLDVCDSENRLKILSLPQNNLNGTLPPSYNHFVDAIVFDIGQNNIGGEAPTNPGNIPLEVFIVSQNKFSGVATSTGALSELSIRVHKVDGNAFANYFAGLLFPFWGPLEIWNVTDNLFHGFISSTLGHCRNLTYLGAGSTQLGGVLPSELGLLTKLEEIDISHSHKFQGTLPSELGNLQKLTHLDVTGTSLTGTIPELLCNRLRDPDDMLTIAASCDIIDCCAL